MDFGVRVQKTIYENGNSNAPEKLPFAITSHIVTQLRDFVYAKPQIGQSFVRTILWDQGPVSMTTRQGTTRTILSSGTWAVKCKSRTALRQAFGDSNETDLLTAADFPNTFAKLNQQTFHHVLNKVVRPDEKARYVKSGLPMAFLPDRDKMTSSSLDWICSDLELNRPKNEAVRVAAPVGYTCALDESKELKFRGMHYGKLLSPAQCYEWIVSGCWRYANAVQ